MPLSWLKSLQAERTWQLEHRGFAAPPPLPTEANARLVRLLFEAGRLLSRVDSPWHPAAWYPLFRYVHLIANGGDEFRLDPGVVGSDPRLIASFSEDLAVGMAGYVARTYFGITYLADTYDLMRSGEVKFAAPPVDGESRPDYFALDLSDRRMFIEVKGAVGTRSALKAPLAKGKLQVRNVEAPGYRPCPAGDRLVMASNFCVETCHPRSHTTTVILDPPSPSEPPGEDRRSDLPVRLSYANALALGLRSDMAEALISRTAWKDADLRSPEIRRGVVPVGLFPALGTVVIDAEVWEVLRRHEEVDLSEALQPILEGLGSRRDNETLLMLNDGVGLSFGF